MELFIFDLQKETCLHCLPNKGRIQRDGWIGLLATPSLGSLKPEIIKVNKTITGAILSRIVPISLYQVSPPPPSNILDPPLQAYQNLNPDSIESLFTEHITSHNLKDNLKFEHTRSESKALNNSFTH